MEKTFKKFMLVYKGEGLRTKIVRSSTMMVLNSLKKGLKEALQ